jgi:uncharacterized protein
MTELSKYFKIWHSSESRDSRVLFSTKNASSIIIPHGMLKDIMQDGVASEEREILSSLGFLVKDSRKECEEMLHFIEELNAVDTVFAAKVVLNLDCNLACSYCFEGQRKGKFYMGKETAERFIGFIRESLGRSGRVEEVRLTFYGGEPLLSFTMLIYLSGKIQAFCLENGYRYKGFIITNGTLLTGERADKLRAVGVCEAAITIDGPREVHDRFRPFRTGQGSFETIVRNIKESCGIVNIELGGNFTRNNFRTLPLMLDYLMKEGLTPNRLPGVRFDAVTMESEGFGPTDFREGCCSFNEPWLFEAALWLREEILKRGYRANRVVPRACLIDIADRFVVNHDGSLYKCPGLIGREEYKIGDLQTGIKDYRQSHNLDNWKNAECLDCAYLPLCFGGCRYMKLVRDGNMEGVDCKKPYFDATLETMVKQEIRYGLCS